MSPLDVNLLHRSLNGIASLKPNADQRSMSYGKNIYLYIHIYIVQKLAKPRGQLVL